MIVYLFQFSFKFQKLQLSLSIPILTIKVEGDDGTKSLYFKTLTVTAPKFELTSIKSKILLITNKYESCPESKYRFSLLTLKRQR